MHWRYQTQRLCVIQGIESIRHNDYVGYSAYWRYQTQDITWVIQGIEGNQTQWLGGQFSVLKVLDTMIKCVIQGIESIRHNIAIRWVIQQIEVIRNND